MQKPIDIETKFSKLDIGDSPILDLKLSTQKDLSEYPCAEIVYDHLEFIKNSSSQKTDSSDCDADSYGRVEFYPSYQKGNVAFNVDMSASKPHYSNLKPTTTDYQKVFSNIRMGESPSELTPQVDPHYQDALEYFRTKYIEDKQGFEDLDESMFEENSTALHTEVSPIDPERNPLSLQPLYIKEENYLKYIPDKDYASQILAAERGGFGLPLPEEQNQFNSDPAKDCQDVQAYLEAVKNKQEAFDYRKVKDHLVEVCENETGSFKVQEIFNSGAYNEKKEIFEQIKSQVRRLISNKFGNYVIQKIVEKCPRGMKDQVVVAIRDDFASFCLDYYASKVIKKMFDCFDNEMRYSISVCLLTNCYRVATSATQKNLQSFEHTFLTLMCNSDASIIVQKLIEKGFYPKLKELKSPEFCYSTNALQIYNQYQGLLKVVNNHVVELAQDVYGCRVLNICMETFPIHVLDGVIQQVMANLDGMVNHKYANYVVQSLLEHHPNFYHDSLKTYVSEHALHMCLNKFSSFVIEKVAKHTHKSIKLRLYELVFNLPLNHKNAYKNSALFRMLYNEYGNFILKRLYEFEENLNYRREYKKKIIEVYRQTYVHNNFYAHKLVNQLRDDHY